jgi:putative transposase
MRIAHIEVELVPELPQRKITRLPEFDYRSPGPYVVTICTQGRRLRFGAISPEGDVRLNEIGFMILGVWNELPNTFPGTELDACVLMPNHVHGILTLGTASSESNPDLANVIQWFKGVSTHRYINGVREEGWPRFEGRLWQSKFYEHIIRDDRDMGRCQQYIAENPARWATDRYHDPG